MFLSPPEPVLAAVTIGIASMVQGYLGFGMALLAVPILGILNPEYVPGPVIANGLLLTILIGAREISYIRINDLKWSITGAFAGSVLGALLLAFLAGKLPALNILTGILVLAGALASNSKIGDKVTINPMSLFSVGTVSGFMGTCSAIGGPVIALLYQNEKGAKIRATLSVYFVFSTVIALVALGIVGALDRLDTTLSLYLMPGTLLGFILSGFIKHAVNDRFIKAGIYVVSVSASLVLILKNFPGLIDRLQ